MKNNPRKALIALFGILFFVIIIVFAYSRIAPRLRGPQLVAISLSAHDRFEGSSLELRGTVRHTNTLDINGRKIALDKENKFRETVVLSPGYTIIELVLFDTFGKSHSYQYPVYSNAEQGVPIEAQTELTEEGAANQVAEEELLTKETTIN